ncbi:peptidase [Rothia sp. HMSC069C03]|jgi:periplasmic protease|uniref:peptidase n=1 Tax=Rothia sp. HMSC069C03 TaxID=1739283 RepID=UPI0008D27A3C|nr:peptidase [Rothia sp. HMSC069C03]OFL19965.1 peptidase [Rothia sp. HMSC069C03]
MRSKEAHVLESIANSALPTLQIVEYRGETAASASAARSLPSAHPGRYTLRTISQPAPLDSSTPAAPSTQLAPAAPTLREAANGYGFEENTDASAQRHAQTPQVAAALRNAPGLAKLHAVTSESANQLCLWYEPLDAGTLDKLLRARTLTPAELMTLARTLHRALGSLKKVGEGRAELNAEYIALSAAGVPKLLLPDAVYCEAAPQDGEQLTAARSNYARSAAALLWQATCGHTPEPSAARVPLSLRMGATGSAPEEAPSSEWIERLGRALEYLLDAPNQEVALAGLSSVVVLAEEVPPRPLNVYLSCSERARALIPAAVEPAPVQKLSKTQKAQRYLAERLPCVKKQGMKKPGVKKSGRAATAGSKPLIPTASPAETAPPALKNAEVTGTSRLTALRGALTRPTARLGLTVRLGLAARLGIAALALGAIALPLGYTLYGQNAPATAQPVSAQAVNAAGEQAPDGTETSDQSTQDKSAQGDQILRALIDQRNQERRARGGAELTVDTAEELSRDSENIRVMAVVSAPGYRADKTEQEARKLSEENGVTRQKVIFDLHRGEKGWEIARAEPVPA